MSAGVLVNDRQALERAWVRALPFALFILLMAVEPWLARHLSGLIDPRWLYGFRSLMVLGLLAYFWRHFVELNAGFNLKASESGIAVMAGLGVLAVWITLDSGIFVLGQPGSGFDPRTPVGDIDWPLALMRLAGSALVVPVMEELFWRSLVMRWLEDADFHRVDPLRIGLRALFFSSLAFGLEHSQWVAGIVAGLAYGWLYGRNGKLWMAIVAHAVTNGGLGCWVLVSGAWYFW